MPNREKVIKGLEQFKADFKPFCGNSSDWARVDDAIVLLKEQEPVKPQQKTIDGLLPHTFWWYECGNCRWDIEKDDMYCKHCGRPVEWELGGMRSGIQDENRLVRHDVEPGDGMPTRM